MSRRGRFGRYNRYNVWPEYKSVSTLKAEAKKHLKKLQEKGQKLEPVDNITGRKIARTFWGERWCKHLECFSDYSNRLPRGRSYVRNGTVIHLEIQKGKVLACVSGSSIYNVTINIKPISTKKWKVIRKSCTGRIGSLIELLQGKFSDSVMEIVTDPKTGIFPQIDDIDLKCSCPDWATMCKHVAAVLYGVGARLDEQPELLFKLRGVDHEELISTEAMTEAMAGETEKVSKKRLASRKKLQASDISDVFGIDTDQPILPVKRKKTKKPVKATRAASSKKTKKTAVKKPLARKPVTGKMVDNYIKKSGLSVKDFAKFISVTPATIYNWKRKKGSLNIREVGDERRLREALSGKIELLNSFRDIFKKG